MNTAMAAEWEGGGCRGGGRCKGGGGYIGGGCSDCWG